MIKQYELFLLLIALQLLSSCVKQGQCWNEKTVHRLKSAEISLPSCYKFFYPDSTLKSLIWVTKDDTLKFILKIDGCLASSLDSLDPESHFSIEKDTIEQHFMLTTAIRKDYLESYQKKREEREFYDFSDQPFWFSNDLTKESTYDTIVIDTSDSTTIPIVDHSHNCLLTGYTTHPYQTFRPRLKDINELIKGLKQLKMK